LQARLIRTNRFIILLRKRSLRDRGDNSGKAVLRIAAASRIKLFIRPAGLRPAVDKAPAEMRFFRR
jgi:P pilus assembly chaperone PapD